MKITPTKEYFIWEKNHNLDNKPCLAVTSLDVCDKCGRPATINCFFVTSGATAKMKKQADKIQEEYGLLTPLGADEDGNCYCGDCFEEQAIKDLIEEEKVEEPKEEVVESEELKVGDEIKLSARVRRLTNDGELVEIVCCGAAITISSDCLKKIIIE